jgi:hypothetical protein
VFEPVPDAPRGAADEQALGRKLCVDPADSIDQISLEALAEEDAGSQAHVQTARICLRIGVLAERLEQRRRRVCMRCGPRCIDLRGAVAERRVNSGAALDGQGLAEDSLEDFDRRRWMLCVGHEPAEVFQGAGLQAR